MAQILSSIIFYFYWFQLGFAIWQFIRVTKFCKIPYAFVYALFTRKLGKFFLREQFVYSLGRPDDTVKDYERIDRKITEYNVEGLKKVDNLYYKFNDLVSNEVVLLDYAKMANYLYCRQNGIVFGNIDSGAPDLLFPGFFLYRKASDDELRGGFQNKSIFKYKTSGFFDFSPSEGLNQNFLRLMSIAPLALQARGFDFYSVGLSIFLIFLDLASVWANRLWVLFKENLYVFVKNSIAGVEDSNTRVQIHAFLSTISSGFKYCDEVRKKSYYLNTDSIFVSHSCSFISKLNEIQEFERVKDQLCYCLLERASSTVKLNGSEYKVEYSKISSDKWRYVVSSNEEVFVNESVSYKTLLNKITCLELLVLHGGIVCNTYDNRKAHITSMTSILTYPDYCTFLIKFRTMRKIYFSDHQLNLRIREDIC